MKKKYTQKLGEVPQDSLILDRKDPLFQERFIMKSQMNIREEIKTTVSYWLTEGLSTLREDKKYGPMLDDAEKILIECLQTKFDSYSTHLKKKIEGMKKYSGQLNGKKAVYMTDEYYNQALEDVKALLQEEEEGK
jgi:hypothetical protein